MVYLATIPCFPVGLLLIIVGTRAWKDVQPVATMQNILITWRRRAVTFRRAHLGQHNFDERVFNFRFCPAAVVPRFS